MDRRGEGQGQHYVALVPAAEALEDNYIARFEAGPLERMFFVCHSPQGHLSAGRRRDVHVWTGASPSERAVEAGLFSWLMDGLR